MLLGPLAGIKTGWPDAYNASSHLQLIANTLVFVRNRFAIGAASIDLPARDRKKFLTILFCVLACMTGRQALFDEGANT